MLLGKKAAEAASKSLRSAAGPSSYVSAFDKSERHKIALEECAAAQNGLAAVLMQDRLASECFRCAAVSKSVHVSEVPASARPLFIKTLCSCLSGHPPILWITPSSDSAERLIQDAKAFLSGESYLFFPERENAGVFGDDDSGSADPARLSVLQTLDGFKENSPSGQIIIAASLAAVMQPTVQADKLEREKIVIHKDESVDLDFLTELLVSEGYSRVPMVEARGEFSVRGGIVDVYPITGKPARIELYDDSIESMHLLNIDTQRSCGETEEVVLLPAREHDGDAGSMLTDYLRRKAPSAMVVLDEPSQLRLAAREWNQEWQTASSSSIVSFSEDDGSNGVWKHLEEMLAGFRRIYLSSWTGADKIIQDAYGDNVTEENGIAEEPGTGVRHFNLGFAPEAQLARKIEDLLDILPKWQEEGRRVVVMSLHYLRLKELLAGRGISGVVSGRSALGKGQIMLLQGYANEGFRADLSDGALEFITDRELVGQNLRQRSGKKAERSGSSLRLDEITPGDYVVHLNYGIARYAGIETIVDTNQASHDMLKLEYAKGSVLMVPVDKLSLIHKYEGVDETPPKISDMGHPLKWQSAKRKVKAYAAEAARKLMELKAKRDEARGFACSPDTEWQLEMENAFPYQTTPDQDRAIAEVKSDQESSRPMERLICGDVGYGKTEVAIRAAFKAVASGLQVAVMVPTTILAYQHYTGFSERFDPFSLNTRLLSRFTSKKERDAILEEMASGTCDVVIGTHSLLSKGVKFKKLGLLIIDEEHRFGALQKAKLQEISSGVDIMTMSATPIPRTLQMVFKGVNDMSLIATPPEERMPVKTYLFEHSSDLIKAAVTRELNRQGQVYLLHNRVETIDHAAAELQKLVPGARIAVGHGQMSKHDLEDIMIDFYNGNYDVLVCSTIIESGLDVPNVNTIIIDDAHRLGLAQLYQLRGRVGRSSRQGYCYMLYPAGQRLNEEAQKRLSTIREFTQLGAGFQIAKRDLEIRGAGDILGASQSGFVSSLGTYLYYDILEKTFEAVRNGREPDLTADEEETREQSVVVDLPVSANIPESYVDDAQQRVAIYKRLADIASFEELEELNGELKDRYGKRMPENCLNLFELARIKLRCFDLMICALRISAEFLYAAAPFMTPLTFRELAQLSDRTGLRASQNSGVFKFSGLYGKAAGNVQYPPAEIILGKVNAMLDFFAALPDKRLGK